MKVTYNITQNKFNAILNQETTEIKVSFKTGYYHLPVGLENYYTKIETNSLLQNYYLKTETYNQEEINSFLDLKADLSQLNNYYTKSETFSQSQINTYLGLKLDKGGYTGTAQSLKNEIDNKQNLLSSFDESILIETDGNIEGNVSLFQEYFEQQECELNFTPIQIVA